MGWFPRQSEKFSKENRIFRPILAGATARERAIACVGSLIGISLTGFLCSILFGNDPHLPLIIAPIGASAVLLFAVPASPLAQPWSIVGGNTISALVGVAVFHVVDEPVIAAGLAVSLAIGVMSLTRSLHPPGGAVALTTVLGGQTVWSAGFMFAFVPVALNSALLVILGICFHKFSRRTYPHIPSPVVANTHGTQDPPARLRIGFQSEDLDKALESLDESFDVDRDDLDRLFKQVELQAMMRTHSEVLCRDIMSRDVIKVVATTDVGEARHLLLEHNVRILPVIDNDGRLVGTVGLRDLAYTISTVEEAMIAPVIAKADDTASSLLPALTDGRAHAVVIVDEKDKVLGLITQTDLLLAIAHLPLSKGFQQNR